MLYIVQFEDVYTDQPERLAERATHMDAHLGYLAAQGNRVVASGALRETEGSTPLGGMWIVDAPSRSDVDALVQGDPFWNAGLRKAVRISVWAKAFWSPAFAQCVESISPS